MCKGVKCETETQIRRQTEMANENVIQNSGRETTMSTKKGQPKSEEQDKRTTKDIRRVTANTPALIYRTPPLIPRTPPLASSKPQKTRKF
jgi:hypothetical protein